MPGIGVEGIIRKSHKSWYWRPAWRRPRTWIPRRILVIDAADITGFSLVENPVDAHTLIQREHHARSRK